MANPSIDPRHAGSDASDFPGSSLKDALRGTLDVPTDLEARRRRHWRMNVRWSVGLLTVWALVTFGVAFFARPLNIEFLGWPLSFWVAAQGALLVFGALVVIYAVVMKRLDATVADPPTGSDPLASSFH